MCVGPASSETPAGWGWSTLPKMWGELSVTKKYTLLTFKWHSGPAGSLLVLKAGQTPSTRYPEHVKTNTGIVSNSEKRWPPSSVCGGHTVTFSYLLMAEIISSSFPLQQYITLFYNYRMKKPFTSHGALQYVQDWSNMSSEVKKKI